MERSTQANTKAFIAVFDEIYFWTSSFLSLSQCAFRTVSFTKKAKMCESRERKIALYHLNFQYYLPRSLEIQSRFFPPSWFFWLPLFVVLGQIIYNSRKSAQTFWHLYISVWDRAPFAVLFDFYQSLKVYPTELTEKNFHSFREGWDRAKEYLWRKIFSSKWVCSINQA